jgi:hypothetical protein
MALESLADGARSVAWGAGGYQLLALPFSSGGSEHEGDGSFVRFSFWHSSAAHSPSQGGAMPVLLGSDRIVVWKGLITDVPSFNACVRVLVLSGGGGADRAGLWRATTRRDEEWDHLQFPQRYLSQNAPILRCAVSQVWRREQAGAVRRQSPLPRAERCLCRRSRLAWAHDCTPRAEQVEVRPAT